MLFSYATSVTIRTRIPFRSLRAGDHFSEWRLRIRRSSDDIEGLPAGDFYNKKRKSIPSCSFAD